MIVNKKTVLKLTLISIAAIVIGVAIGLVLNYQTIKNLRSPKVESTPPPGEGGWSHAEKPEEKIATYSGKIKPSIQPEIAAHYLEDDEGNIIVFLQSGKIESGFLEMLEGQMVEVVGEIVKTVEGGQEVLEVDEVHL